MSRALIAGSASGLGGRAAGRQPGGVDEHRLALERLRVKQQVIAELIGGRLQLLEATARFRDAQRLPGRDRAGAQRLAFAEDGELLCRTVIGWAHLALSDRPERAETFSEGLEQELQAHLARHGT